MKVAKIELRFRPNVFRKQDNVPFEVQNGISIHLSSPVASWRRISTLIQSNIASSQDTPITSSIDNTPSVSSQDCIFTLHLANYLINITFSFDIFTLGYVRNFLSKYERHSSMVDALWSTPCSW